MRFGWKPAAVPVGVVLYFVAGYTAFERRHHRRRDLCAVNILRGWTGIGWMVALAMRSRR